MNYSLRAAARLAGVTEQRTRYLIRVRQIAAARVDGSWVLSFSEVARLKQIGSARRRRGATTAQLPLALELPSAGVVQLGPAAQSATQNRTHEEDVDALRERAYALEQSDPAAALSLHRVVAAATDEPADWANLLAALHEHKHGAEAVTLARQLRTMFADSAIVQFNCGVALHGQRLFAEAAVAYETALTLDTDHLEAHRYLHECYEALGQQQLAIRHGAAWLRAGKS